MRGDELPVVGDHRRTRVTFESGGVAIAGYLYRPAGSAAKLPCVVLANGFTGTMDWVLPRYAEQFAAAGFAALIFDYRYFGESEGQPRQLVSVRRQREDIRRAVEFARASEGIDPRRIALWGTSLGGGHVIAIAAERAAGSEQVDVATVIAQVPGIDMVRRDARATIKVPASVLIKLLAAAVRDAVQGALRLPPYYAKVFGKPGETAVFTDPGLKPNFDALMANSPHWRNAFTPRFYLALPRFQPKGARRITVPLLVCVAERDVYANPDFPHKVGRLAPRGEVLRYPADHFDFYNGLLDRVARDEIAFLRRHLAPDQAPTALADEHEA